MKASCAYNVETYIIFSFASFAVFTVNLYSPFLVGFTLSVYVLSVGAGVSIEDYINNKPLSTIKIKMEVTHEDTTIPTDETKYTLTSENVPIPEGYYYVGGTKNTGVVISDNENDKNKGDAHSVSATLQGNQFVWVPVLQNQKIKIEITAEEPITSVELLDPTGTEIETPAPKSIRNRK